MSFDLEAARPYTQIRSRNRNMAAKKKSAKILRCPTCGMLVQANDEDFPFCSDRCRKIDLGKWAMGVYKISSPVLDPEVLEDLGGLSGGQDRDSDRE
ncbi:MAG TPA: DNA gyrase inhibitor YacG [Terracidiphilus sp.]|nr:DNA gyrase inhibitor YacG [Terracidiphilus sp.]